jgi:hypothetical protein
MIVPAVVTSNVPCIKICSTVPVSAVTTDATDDWDTENEPVTVAAAVVLEASLP